MTRLRTGVAISTLLGSAIYILVSISVGNGWSRADAFRDAILAVSLAALMSALAPVIANSLSPTRKRWEIARAVGFWALLFPLITMFPLGLICGLSVEGGYEFVLRVATFCSWTAGATGGVVFASAFAHWTSFSLVPSRVRSRLLVVSGVVMSTLTFVLVLPDIMIVLAAVVLGLSSRNTPATEYVFPESFSGTATLRYPVASAPPGKRNKEGWIFEFSTSGKLAMSDSSLGDQYALPKFFFADSMGRRRSIRRGLQGECFTVTNDTTVTKQTNEDMVCAHFVSFNGGVYRQDFTVLRAHGLP